MSNTQSVRPFNREILGMEGTNNLIGQTLPALAGIDISSFRAGDRSNVLGFMPIPTSFGRLGIFVAEKNGVERVVIMLLPQNTRPDGILICVTQGFQQASRTLDK